MRTTTSAPGRPNLVALAVLGCLAAGSGTGLAATLVSCAPHQPAEGPRPVSAAEADRLARMRLANHHDGRAGLTATIGTPGAHVRVTGWVDWRRSVVYAAVDGPAAGEDRGLLQAVPRLIALRPGKEPAPATTAGGRSSHNRNATVRAGAPGGARPVETRSVETRPPAVPPADGWRVRPTVTAGGTRPAVLDVLLNLVFAVAADRPDPIDPLRNGDARWLGRDRVAGVLVDVLLGPVAAASVPAPTNATSPKPTGPTPTSAAGSATSAATDGGRGNVRYWLDGTARLHRLEALLTGDVPVRVDFDRTERPELTVIAALGGAPVRPRPVTAAEAELLARMRPAEDWDGARISLDLPTVRRAGDRGSGPPANLRGAGWITWYGPTAYLTVRELDGTAGALLLRADRDGVAVLPATEPTGAEPIATKPTDTGKVPLPSGPRMALPPLPPPTDGPWSYRQWQQRDDGHGASDLDLLLTEALTAGAVRHRDPGRLRPTAAWLRPDVVGREPVTVFELRKPAEAGVAAGQGRLRYWVNRAGALRRLELRTRSGAFAQLDINPSRVPYLPRVPTG